MVILLLKPSFRNERRNHCRRFLVSFALFLTLVLSNFFIAVNRILSPLKCGREQRSADEDKIMQCTGCREKFTMINRKHHCGKCGNLFCGNCTSSKENLNNGAIKERICISCSTRAFLLRRKAKAPKKIAKSIVIKSAKFGKLDVWDSPEPVKQKCSASTTELPELSVPLACSQAQMKLTSPLPNTNNKTTVLSPGEDEDDALISKPTFEVENAEEEDEEFNLKRMNQGMLCILPPTVFSFLFGTETSEQT